VPSSHAEVAIQSHRRRAPERQGPLPSALAEDQGDVQVEVKVGEPQASDLAAAGAGVQEEGDQRGVPAALEALAGTCGQQPPQGVLGQDRDGLVGHHRRLHTRHGVDRDLLFILQPTVQRLELLIAGRGGRGRPAGQQLGDERLQVGAGRRLELAPAGLEEGGELTDADQVAGDRAVGEVLGPQVPLEGAAEAEGSLPCMVGP
jgi:hypothetical protein